MAFTEEEEMALRALLLETMERWCACDDATPGLSPSGHDKGCKLAEKLAAASKLMSRNSGKLVKR